MVRNGAKWCGNSYTEWCRANFVVDSLHLPHVVFSARHQAERFVFCQSIDDHSGYPYLVFLFSCSQLFDKWWLKILNKTKKGHFDKLDNRDEFITCGAYADSHLATTFRTCRTAPCRRITHSCEPVICSKNPCVWTLYLKRWDEALEEGLEEGRLALEEGETKNASS